MTGGQDQVHHHPDGGTHSPGQATQGVQVRNYICYKEITFSGYFLKTEAH